MLMQRQVDAALGLSTVILEQAQAEKRLEREIEILILRALAFSEKKDMPQALANIEQALALAQPEGYAHIFLDEGAPLAKLIFQASARGLDSGYAARLLLAFAPGPNASHRPAQALIEPLTEREIEVLKLIENGCANQEIAAKLFISIPTVKRHISNIYAKLGAKNRTQAVSLARELSLFEGS
jgi:LuxR family maltose regulon positive regulatory protein